MKCDVKNLENKVTGQLELNDSIFGLPVRKDILMRAVAWQLAKARSGNHKTKGVSDVSGTTKKPWAQKGTGRARAGSLRTTQMRGGGIVFGPVVRSHAHKLTKKFRALALKTALSAKQASGKLFIVESLDMGNPKAKELAGKLDAMGLKSVLFIGGETVNENFVLSASNLKNVHVLPQQGANVYSILKAENLVLTKDAIHHLEARLS